MNIDEVSSKRLSMSAMMSADPVGQPAKADNVGRAFLAFALTLANSQSLGMGPLALPDRVILLPVQVQALVRQQQRDGPRWVLVYLGLRCLWKGCVAWREPSLEGGARSLLCRRRSLPIGYNEYMSE